MSENLRLMAILAHPDDESLGTGGILARYAVEGVETYLVTATRGERGWFGPKYKNPGLEKLGEMREAELRAAASKLGMREVNFLNYIDGDLDQADPDEVIAKIVSHIRRVRPQVVVTFEPYGIYGHQDHIAISQFTTAAAVAAADAGYTDPEGRAPHRVAKLYYLVAVADELEAYQSAFGELKKNVDGEVRRAEPWAEWAVTTRVNTGNYWRIVMDAISCHQTQLPGYDALIALPDAFHQSLWEEQTFYRAFSFVNGGRQVETDLFEGLRQTKTMPSSELIAA